MNDTVRRHDTKLQPTFQHKFTYVREYLTIDPEYTLLLGYVQTNL